MRFFQQTKFQFTDQLEGLRSTASHKTHQTAANNMAIRPSNLPALGNAWLDNMSSHDNLTETINRQSNGMLGRRLIKRRTLKMLALSSCLVVLLHGLGLIWLWRPAEQIAPARPIAMEVTIIPVAAPKPKLAPPPPSPAPAKVKPLPKKAQAKPVLKKIPIVQEPADFTPMTPPVAQNLAATPTAGIAPAAKIEPFIEANINADYAENPKPDYPSLARSMGWQGKVMLKVQVSEEGLSAAVAIEHSSGYEILDESAIEAIKQWRFTPAKRGETAIASSVIVPIIFTLEDQNQS